MAGAEGVVMSLSISNPLFDQHVDLLWSNLIPEFGRLVNYWPGGEPDAAAQVEVIWVEGVEGEEISPGRYSHILVRNDSLPADPQQGDSVEKDGSVFDIERIDAFAYRYSRCVLKGRY
jgi:hypothetical protein